MTKRKDLKSVSKRNPFAQLAPFASQKAVDLSLIQNNNNNNNNNKANRRDIIIKNKKRENMHIDRLGNTRRQKFRTKGRGKEAIIQEFMYRDATTVEPTM